MDSRDSSKVPRPRPASRWLYLAIPLLCLATAYWSFYPTRTDQQPYLPLVQTALFPCDPNEPVKRVAIIGESAFPSSTLLTNLTPLQVLAQQVHLQPTTSNDTPMVATESISQSMSVMITSVVGLRQSMHMTILRSLSSSVQASLSK